MIEKRKGGESVKEKNRFRVWLIQLLKLAGIVLLCVALFFVNAFAGNPVSWLLAKGSAHRYVEQEYGHLDVQIDKVGYNLKDTNYYAKVSSPTSVDTHFTVYISMLGQVERDTYESVTDGFNTWDRLNDAYTEQVRAVLETLPFESDGGSGDFRGGRYSSLPGVESFGLPHEELEVDKDYDLYALGKEHGSITYRVLDRDVSYERAAEILLCLRDEMENSGVAFRVVNLTLRQPRDENGTWSGPELMIFDFPRVDLYAEDLEEKLEVAYQIAVDHYGEETMLE